MDPKTLSVLEYPKLLERLAAHCDFSASAELARSLAPTSSYDLALARQEETTEARRLLSTHDLSIGGAHDIREKVDLAARGGVLDPADLLDVKSTLISSREIKKTLEKLNLQAPRLGELALSLPDPKGVVDSISRVLSEKGEVLDSASPKLASIRRELRVSYDRLMARMQKYITDPHTMAMLQDSLITQRDGRYVIPLRAEFKGQLKSIVHDQSASGATLFVEPLAVVEMNNAYRELQLAERDEERRVLAEVSGQIGLAAGEIVPGIEALAQLDLAFAKAKYAEEIRGGEPILHKFDDGKRGNRPSSVVCNLLKARHPLLDPASVVPIDVTLAPDVFALVITGPNTGGKTVSLKSVGLMVVMAQAGLHIPAQSGSELSVFRDVYADIGDEQSIEQSLSTFSGHITNIIRILKQADDRSLVILDELGAGTDPQEGAAIARAILSHLLERGVTTFVATHYPELKTFAHSTPGVVNASLEFDLKTLRPTYHLTIGLPGRSNALAIAQRLGLPESIIAMARSEINPADLRADKLLDDIRRERNRSSREREKAEKARARTDELNRELAKRLEKIEDERREILEKARAEAELEVAVLLEQIEALKAQLKKARQPLEALKEVEKKAAELEAKAQAPAARRTDHMPIPAGALKLGEKVILRSLDSEGIVTALGESEAEVQIGALRVRAKLNDLLRKSDETSPADAVRPPAKKGKARSGSESSRSAALTLQASPGMELDIRGQMVDDALIMLDDYLDRAFVAGMPFVRIIHGKGTGKLRQAIREALKGHPHIASFEAGHESEGGDGVTIAKIANE
jgi:DNA mismatch repair protein MutS2